MNAKPKNIQKVYEKLSNREEVLRSKQLPFRFLSAYKEIIKGVNGNFTTKAIDAIEQAIEYSVENMPKLKGKTVIAYDISGSMGSSVSSNSDVTCAEISALLAVLASKICDEYMVLAFNNSLEIKNISSKSPILSTALQLKSAYGGTSLQLQIEHMIDKNIYADRLIMISDNEINGSWYSGFKETCQIFVDKYRNTINKNLYVHAIDLQGYGTQQFIGTKTNIIVMPGWSEKVLDFIGLAEEGTTTIIKTIENYLEP